MPTATQAETVADREQSIAGIVEACRKLPGHIVEALAAELSARLDNPDPDLFYLYWIMWVGPCDSAEEAERGAR